MILSICSFSNRIVSDTNVTELYRIYIKNEYTLGRPSSPPREEMYQ